MIYFNIMKNLLKKKIGLILFFGIICAFLSGLEKQYFTNFTVEIGNYRISQVLKITDYNKKDDRELPFAYDRLITDKNYIVYFFDDVKDLEIKDLDPNWDKYDGDQKVKWFEEHFTITNLNQGLYIISLNLDKIDTNNKNSVLELGEKIINTYVDYSKIKVQEIYPGVKFSQRDSRVHRPEKKQLSKNKIVFKYALLGFIFGSILATGVLLIINIRKGKENGR